MKLTNLKGFPDALVKAIQNDPYTKGEKADYSVTGLLKPARAVALERAHKDELEDDVSDRLFALYGQIAHLVLERANEKDLAEQRYYAEFNGKILSGQIDTLSFKDGVLTDWKFTTSWGFKTGQPAKPEWVAQLNMQRELLLQNKEKIEAHLGIENLEIKALQITGLLRDWSKMEARRSKDYPQKAVVTLPIEIWSREQTQSFIKMRISEHEAAKTALPLCTNEERWAKPDVFAVMKRGKARALSLQYSEDTAHSMARDVGGYVQFRPGESVRCENYCAAAPFCAQFKALKQSTTDEEKDAV